MIGVALRAAWLAAFGVVAGFAVGAGLDGAARLAVAIVAVLLLAGFGFAAFWPTGRALAEVSAAARRLGGAGAGERVASTSGATAELTASFNAMAGHVEGILADVRAEQARLEAMIYASSSGVVALSSDTTVQLLNRAAAQLLGTVPEAAIGRPLIESARDFELDSLVRAAAAGESATLVVTFGAGRVPLQVSARPIPGGGEWAVLLLLVDLTEVTRVDQVRRDFLSNVSHELRTPLASIRALAETLDSGDVDPGEETHEFVHRIVVQAERMTTLVNEFLDLSRIESGAVELRPEPIPVDDLVSESIGLLRQRAEAAHVELTPAAPTGLRFEADRAAVLRVVNNLVDNAIKFSPPGSTVSVEAADAGDLVAISVRDQGPGITPADLPRVFERFYKGDHSRANGGVGLGLAIVKHTVRLHGGTAEVQSEPGHGATFTVRLPKHFVPLRVSPRR